MTPIIISFSGIDGAGKSTQIQKLQDYLAQEGLSVKVLTFWDNVVMFPKLRAGFSKRMLQSDGRVGTPERPAERRDKNKQNLPLLLGRSVLHCFDIIKLRRMVAAARRQNCNVVIFDRYIYDQLAALPLQSGWARGFAKALLRVTPKPDLSYVLDADPELARARKPEYPLDFMRKYRSSYLELRTMANLTLVQPGAIDEVHQAIVDAFSRCLVEKQFACSLESTVAA